MAGEPSGLDSCGARSILSGKRAMAQKHQQTGMERRFVIYPQTIRSENTPFASGSQRNRYRMALSGKRCLAGNFACPTISQRTCFYLYTTEIANHSGRQSNRNKIARLQQRLGSFPPAQKRILRFYFGYRRRHHRRRYVQGPAQKCGNHKSGLRLRNRQIQLAIAGTSPPLVANIGKYFG